MPNYCYNRIVMKNITQLPFFSSRKADTVDKDCLYFDFNKLIEMPEKLQIEAGSIESVAVEMAIRFYEKYGECFKEYHQYSDEEWEQRRSNYKESDQELADKGLEYFSNAVKYHASTWYNWCWKHWGTKWNSFDLEIVEPDEIRFVTAWSPPVPVIEELSKRNPKTLITHHWEDEYIGNGSGYLQYLNGSVIKELYANGEEYINWNGEIVKIKYPECDEPVERESWFPLPTDKPI